ncbi:hypothetical protein ACP4OV_028817 [Aristida adscensionis]
MGRKGRWFDSVQRILSTSEPDPEEKEAKAVKSREKSSFKKIWQFSKSSSSGASTSATPAPEAQEQAPSPPPSQSEQQQVDEITEVEETRNEHYHAEAIAEASSVAEQASAAAAAAEASPAAGSPRARRPRSKEDLAAIRIQTACRGYLARRALRARGMARLTSLVEGPAVRRQTEESLYCMQAMTRIQTQIYSRRLKTEDDKKALKSQIKVKQCIDKKKVSEGWDHSQQSKEQMEAVLTMKQEAATRRQKALSYAFSNQWRNRNRKPSAARAAPAPMFMDPGNPNWGWSWTERWMAAARPWESQTTPEPGSGRAAAKGAGGRRPRVALSVQTPRTPTGRSSFRPPSWPSLPSPSTPPPRSPSLPGRTGVPASPRSSPLHGASGLQRAASAQSAARPRSSQDAPAVSSPRRAGVPASPRAGGGGGGSPLHASAGQLRVQPDRRPRSSQERAVSSPRHGAGATDAAPLRRTSSLRSEPLRRLSLGGASSPAAAAAAGDDAPVTPSYMQPTKSVRAKARPPSPAAADKVDAPDWTPRAPSPSSATKRLSLEAAADKASGSTPRKTKAPPSPRTSLA